MQFPNGHTPDGRQGDNLAVVIAPGKMVCPIHFPRVKQRSSLIGQFVYGYDLGIFVIVTSLACQRKVVRIVASAVSAGSDMLDRVRLSRKLVRTPTILTAPTCPLPNQVLYGVTDGGHGRSTKCFKFS